MRMCLRVADRLIYKVAQLNFKRMAMLLTRRIQGASIKKNGSNPFFIFLLASNNVFRGRNRGRDPA